uniref:Olfactory receptor n=1 Tax=Sphenodon punctatus TaxID=8508 RepID=A0A8D0H3X8_SPHPU
QKTVSMEAANSTSVQEFILLGFSVGKQNRLLLLALFTVVYILTLAENLLIMVLVLWNARLSRLPMYILLGHFSWLEMCYVTSTVPRMLSDLMSPQGVISFHDCFIQFYIFFSLGFTECFLLSAMALDRYLAICHPLHYPMLMSQRFCYALVASCWLLGFMWYALPLYSMSKLSYCGTNIIDHFVCDPGPLLALACPPLGHIKVLCSLCGSTALLGTFIFIVISYALVVLTLVRMPSLDQRLKGFSTISSHLTVVTLFYSSVAAMYVVPGSEHQAAVIKIVTLFYTTITPLINPLIYCLRNEGVRKALEKAVRKKIDG